MKAVRIEELGFDHKAKARLEDLEMRFCEVYGEVQQQVVRELPNGWLLVALKAKEATFHYTMVVEVPPERWWFKQ